MKTEKEKMQAGETYYDLIKKPLSSGFITILNKYIHTNRSGNWIRIPFPLQEK